MFLRYTSCYLIKNYDVSLLPSKQLSLSIQQKKWSLALLFGAFNFSLIQIFIFHRPGLSSVITGYLPSVILSGFVYVVPFVMKGMARVAGYVSRSQQDQKASNMVYYFLMGNVFFLSVLSGSLLDQIGKTFINPGDVPSRLAMAVSAQVSGLSIFCTCYSLS